ESDKEFGYKRRSDTPLAPHRARDENANQATQQTLHCQRQADVGHQRQHKRIAWRAHNLRRCADTADPTREAAAVQYPSRRLREPKRSIMNEGETNVRAK